MALVSITGDKVEAKPQAQKYEIAVLQNDNGDYLTTVVTGFLKFGNMFVVVTDSDGDNGIVLFAVATGLFRTATVLNEATQ